MPALSLILVWVGTKMMISEIYKVPTVASLLLIITVLIIAVVASLKFPKKEEGHAEEDPLVVLEYEGKDVGHLP